MGTHSSGGSPQSSTTANADGSAQHIAVAAEAAAPQAVADHSHGAIIGEEGAACRGPQIQHGEVIRGNQFAGDLFRLLSNPGAHGDPAVGHQTRQDPVVVAVVFVIRIRSAGENLPAMEEAVVDGNQPAGIPNR
jgi:hypothetical protein